MPPNEDSSFGTGGKVIVSFTGGATTEKDKALMVQTDGRIVVAGQSGSNFVVARLSGGGTRYYAMQDANWNVTGVADGAGNVVERYQYDPYGKVTVLGQTKGTRTYSCSASTQTPQKFYIIKGSRPLFLFGLVQADHREVGRSIGVAGDHDAALFNNRSS